MVRRAFEWRMLSDENGRSSRHLRRFSSSTFLKSLLAMKTFPFLICGALLTAFTLPADGIVINFDVDAGGNTINAPSLFSNTSPLTELYAPFGIHFSSGASPNSGAILNQ